MLCADFARADSTDLVARPLVLARGELEARVTLEYSFVPRTDGPPSIAPDAWFGVTDRLTLGAIHSSASVHRIDSRATFCLRDSASGCDRTYRGSGLDARYAVTDAIAPRVRLLLRDVDPWKPAVTLGTLARWTRGRFAITVDPFLRLGLANREQGNRAAFSLPGYFGVQPTCRWMIELHTGADGDLAVLRDGWHMPLGLAVTARATTSLDVRVEAGGTQVYGPQVDIRQRHAMVTVAYRASLAKK